MENVTESAAEDPSTQAHGESLGSERPAPSAPRSRPSRAPSSRLAQGRALPLAAVVVVFFLAVLLGRALEPALLGWRAGLEHLIERVELGTAILGQLAVAAGCLTAIQLLIATLVEHRLNVLYRLAIAPLTAALITLVMASATRELPLLLVMVLALLTGLMAALASIPTMIADHTRAAGFVLALGSFTALLQITARTVAVWASHEALTTLFRSAQALSTLVFALDVLVLGLVGVWLASRRYLLAGAIAAGLAIVSALLALAAVRGAGHIGGWSVLANKAFASLARHPWPFAPAALQYGVQAMLLLVVPVTLFVRRERRAAALVVALALLARGGTDLPLHALALGLAALAGPLAAARELADSAPPSSAARQPA
jgi:hypothetical protein